MLIENISFLQADKVTTSVDDLDLDVSKPFGVFHGRFEEHMILLANENKCGDLRTGIKQLFQLNIKIFSIH